MSSQNSFPIKSGKQGNKFEKQKTGKIYSQEKVSQLIFLSILGELFSR
jgi:hypothetical protein